MRNVVQLCLAANNILLMGKLNHAFHFLVITLSSLTYKRRVGRSRQQAGV